MPTVADLRVKFSADVGGAITGIRKVDDSIRHLAAGARSALGGLDFGQMFNVAGGNIIASGIRNITSSLVDLGGQALFIYSDYERLTMSLETFAAQELISAGAANSMSEALAMSGERAQEVLSWIEKLAVQSPFESKDISAAFRLAQAYGFTSDQAMRLTQATVDFAAGAGISGAMMDRITLALGQIQARGKVSAQELNQLSEAGINARGILAEAFGVSTSAIMEMIEKGLVPADLAIEAITQSLEQDFGGAAQRQANTFSGLISSLNDLKSIGLREFFTGTFEAIQPSLQSFVEYVTNPAVKENLRAWGDALGQNVAGAMTKVSAAFTAFQSGGFAGLAQSLNIPPAVISAIEFAANNVTLLQGAVLGLGSVLATGAIVTGLAAVGTAIATIVSPIGLVTTGAMLLGAAWTTNFGGIQEKTAAVIEFLRPGFAELLSWISMASQGDFSGLQAGLSGALQTVSATIESFRWEDFVTKLNDWSAYITPIVWGEIVTTSVDWGAYIQSLDWKTIVTTTVDWGVWLTVLPWNMFVKSLEWGFYLTQLDWSTTVTTMSDWGAYITTLPWGDYIATLNDWGQFVGSVAWESFIAYVEWPSFIPTFSWSSFITAIDLSSYIPTFPGWSALFGNLNPFANETPGQNANGTSYWRGGPTWVDERGPELFHFPSGEWAFGSDKGAHLVNLPRGTEIYSHENAMRMMGGAAANFGKSDKLTWIGANADGTTNPPTVWPGGGSSFAPNYNQRLADFGGKFQQAGDKVATKIQRQMEAAAKKHRQELESALESVPGLFGTSPVTQQQMDLAALGIPQNFADDWIRRLTDEVVNGVDWAGVDIKDAAIRAGLDPSLPAKAILELVKQQWNDSSFFAGGKNTDLINQEAVQKALQRQADAASGKAALMNLFGITPEQATGQAVALGTSMRSGIEQGLTQPTAGGGSDLLGSLTEVTPEQMAPIGAGIVNGLTVEIGKTEYADKIGAAFTKLFTGFLEKKEALTDVGSQIMTRITESLGNVAGLDMVGKFASAFRAQLALPDAITTLHDVGARILELVYQGYVDAAKEKDWPKATVTTNTVNPPPATGTPQGRSALALAGAGGPTVNVYATVASGVDIHQVAYQVADIIQKRSRR